MKKRTTIYLEDTELFAAQAVAKAQHKSLNSLIVSYLRRLGTRNKDE